MRCQLVQPVSLRSTQSQTQPRVVRTTCWPKDERCRTGQVSKVVARAHTKAKDGLEVQNHSRDQDVNISLLASLFVA